MGDPDSDEDPTFVTIGTPLEVFEDDEVMKKPIALHEQTVKDQQGRQRFHGAFTGGYSAGFYNTVGSLEGWTPSTFVSSRTKKADQSNRRPEDFMDDEDFAEHGIAPRQISTTETFTSTKKKAQQSTSLGSIIPGDLEAMRNLIIPSRLTIGIKLLRGLGWKEGQGIGPRVKRKVKRRQKPAPGKKVYGCSLPTEMDQEETSSSEDEYAQGLTFAPKDKNPISFKPKHNTHGIGYSGIDPSRALGGGTAFTLFDEPRITKTGRKGISGTAFGVGALEREDADIYDADSMANYDRVIGGEDEEEFHGWTAPSERKKKKSRFGPPTTMSHVQKLLEGFSLASTSLKPNKVYPPPRIPSGYRPVHQFKIADILQNDTQTAATASKLDAGGRAMLLGEVGSVFDLVSKSDKEKIKSAKEGTLPKTDHVPKEYVSESTKEKVKIKFAPQKSGLPKSPLVDSPASKEPEKPKEEEAKPKDPKQPLFKGAMSGFRPFNTDQAKQARYEKFTELKKVGLKQKIADLQVNMTEWEKEREIEEFERASQLYKPMSMIMASRFHHAQYRDDQAADATSEEPKKVVDEAEQAASLKMYGKLTRQSFEWHPDKLVCKRFNIPNPYPSSTIIGLPGTKRGKFTVMDFLTIPTDMEPPPPPPQENVTLASIAAAKQQKTKKPGPLAILNTPSALPPVKPSTSSSPVEEEHESRPPSDVDRAAGESSEMASTTAPTTGTRPPVDFFKAIFDDSDSDSDSDSKDESSPEETKEMDMSKPDMSESSGGDEGPVKETAVASAEPGTPPGSPPPKEERHSEKEMISISHSSLPDKQPQIKASITSKKGIFAMINKEIEKARNSTEDGISGIHYSNIKDTENASNNSTSMIEQEIGPQPVGTPSSSSFGPAPSPMIDLSSRPVISTSVDNSGRVDHSRSEKDKSDDGRRHKHKHKDKKNKKKDHKRDKERDGERKQKHRSRSRDRDPDRKRDKESTGDRSHSRLKETERPRDRESLRDIDSGRREIRSDSKHSRKKERSRSRSPVWVEAKSIKLKDKKKKSKHKKKKSKKLKKKKAKHKESSSGESADSESDSDDDVDVPTNAHILQRLMMLKKP